MKIMTSNCNNTTITAVWIEEKNRNVGRQLFQCEQYYKDCNACFGRSLDPCERKLVTNMASCVSSAAICNAGYLGPTLAEVCQASQFVVFMSFLDKLIRGNEKISGICERVVPIERPDDEYDFIVVGGGAAGPVVASRLTENPKWKVLLLEAGPDEPTGLQVPIFIKPMIGSRVDWNYTSTNESYACLSTNGSCPLSAGRMLGGSMAHNGMAYSRGNPTDYNNWAKIGNKGWEWDKVKPYFLKSEDNGEIERVGRFWHATGGPLSVERFPYLHPFGYSIMAAAAQAGYGINEDLNGANVSGFSISQTTSKHGVRRSSSRAFLWPVRNRKNLHVSLDSQATRIIIEAGKATGVEFYKDGKLRRVRATREVILSAGAIESPHLLLLSGIGPRKHLSSKGIKVVHDLPGVGENLHDHVTAVLNFTINDTNTVVNDWSTAAEYIENQNGPLSSIGVLSVIAALASTATTSEYPDIRLYFLTYDGACAAGNVGALSTTGRRPVIVRASYFHSKSRGRISLASKNPVEYPVIWFNYLSDPSDVKGLVEAVKIVLALRKTKALRSHDFKLDPTPLKQCSHHKYASSAYWTCAVHQDRVSEGHIGGSCKMGPASDRMAVVDPRLRVYGIKGLRVADASIMPQPLSGNTAAPTVMIGERAADFIKEDWNY